MPLAPPDDRTETATAATLGERRASEPPAETVTADSAPSATPPSSHVDPRHVVIAPETTAAAVAKPACPDVAAMVKGRSSLDERSRSQRVVDCVGGWLKGEAQEFREGVKREMEEFRTGIDRIGRGLQSFGSKLRRAE
jgi:hypothetical protein